MGNIRLQANIIPSDRLVRPRNREVPAAQLDVVGRRFHEMGGDAFRLSDDLLRRPNHRGPADRDGSRSVGAHSHRRAGGIAVLDVDLALVDSDHLGNHLREGRFVALAVRVASRHDGYGTSRVHTHRGAFVQTGASTELADQIGRSYAASLNVAVDPQAPELAVGFGRLGARSETIKVGDLNELVHRGVVVASVVLQSDRRRVRELVGLYEVSPPDFDGINPQFPGRLVDDPFQLEGRFGSSGAPIGIHRNGVGEDSLHIDVNHRRRVVARHQRAVKVSRHGR